MVGLFPQIQPPLLLPNHRRTAGALMGVEHRHQAAVFQFHRGRITQIPGLDIAGTTLSFVNNTTNAETVVEVVDGKYTAVLAAGYEYTAVLSGLNGVGFTNDSKFVTVADADVANGQISTTLVVEAKSESTGYQRVTVA